MAAINYQLARFEASYGTVESIPEPTQPEVSVAGRSNVGKSSLLNKLFGRKNLVKVSSTPGKTCNVNFFDVDGITFVDLPGYGFARVSKAEKDRWSDLIGGYFELERSFNLVLSLVDIRHEAQKLDRQMIAFLQDAGLPYLVVLTKGDKLSRNKQNAQAALLSKQLEVPHDQMIITSSETGQGIDELKSRIAEACL
jgi:GTP-binding protein